MYKRQLKGGGLVQRTRAERIVSLVISDVVGDPLNVIASGPTVPDPSTPTDALAILKPLMNQVPQSVLDVLNSVDVEPLADFAHVTNCIIGNNQTAITACTHRARELGYSVVNNGSGTTGIARDVGRDLAIQSRDARDQRQGPLCILSGGEPTVGLVPESDRGQGGRNQELALAALVALAGDMQSLAILSGGTDGEDGPTDAAGGVVTSETLHLAKTAGLDASAFLERNDAYPFLDATDSLLRTGPTHTNVMDVRVVLIDGPQP